MWLALSSDASLVIRVVTVRVVTMATMEDFKYYVEADLVQVTYGLEIAEVSKLKLFCVYEGLALKFMLRFGKGTDDSTKHITAVFQLAPRNLDGLYILTTFPDTKPVQVLTWYCNQAPLISNYSTKAQEKKAEHKFTEILQLPGPKHIKLVAPMIKTFSINEWDQLREAYSTQSKDIEWMLSIYHNPSLICLSVHIFTFTVIEICFRKFYTSTLCISLIALLKFTIITLTPDLNISSSIHIHSKIGTFGS
jgi:hypothetical protein